MCVVFTKYFQVRVKLSFFHTVRRRLYAFFSWNAKKIQRVFLITNLRTSLDIIEIVYILQKTLGTWICKFLKKRSASKNFFCEIVHIHLLGCFSWFLRRFVKRSYFCWLTGCNQIQNQWSFKILSQIFFPNDSVCEIARV